MMIMKSLKGIKFFIFLSALVTSNAYGYMLDEQLLHTQKKGCYINYLTEKNTDGWYIVTNREECNEDKYLSGHHDITVYDAFGKPKERLYGYFSKGYWTGDSHIRNRDFNRFSDELGKQKATFEVFRDEQDEIRFIGQMYTDKTNAGTYPAFKVCGPARLMGIIQDSKKLEDKQFLQRIFNRIEREIREICPTEKQVMLFFSPKENPKQEEIEVFVQMNLVNHRHKIVRASELNAIPTPRQIKSEKGEMVSFIAGNVRLGKPKTAPTDLPQNEKELQAVNVDLIEASDIPDNADIILTKSGLIETTQSLASEETQKNETNQTKTPVAEQPINTTTNIVQSSSEQATSIESKSVSQSESKPVSQPEPENEVQEDVSSYFKSESNSASAQKERHQPTPAKKSYLQPIQRMDKTFIERPAEKTTSQEITDVSDTVWSLPHVLLLSKVLNTPVTARVAIHIDQMMMDGTGVSFHPQPIDIEGKYVSEGWHIIKGHFQAYDKKNGENETLGSVRLIQVEECALSICKE